MPNFEKKFVADAMLGRLARWLRIMGCDVLYDSRLDDNSLLSIALSYNRILITKDRELALRAKKNGYLVLGEGTKKQIPEIIRRFEIEPVISGDRCSDCNGIIGNVPRREVENSIPKYTSLIHEIFRRCSSCGRIFWDGSHLALAKKNLAEILNQDDEDKSNS
jgi:hypothetical protein